LILIFIIRHAYLLWIKHFALFLRELIKIHSKLFVLLRRSLLLINDSLLIKLTKVLLIILRIETLLLEILLSKALRLLCKRQVYRLTQLLILKPNLLIIAWAEWRRLRQHLLRHTHRVNRINRVSVLNLNWEILCY
jgi:hypothetical protein